MVELYLHSPMHLHVLVLNQAQGQLCPYISRLLELSVYVIRKGFSDPVKQYERRQLCDLLPGTAKCMSVCRVLCLPVMQERELLSIYCTRTVSYKVLQQQSQHALPNYVGFEVLPVATVPTYTPELCRIWGSHTGGY
jgi:hypothetical protein